MLPRSKADEPFLQSHVGRTFPLLSISGYHVDNLPMARQNLNNVINLYFTDVLFSGSDTE